MAQQWFKFYGGEYLSDPKMLALNSSERSCWMTLLCYASMSGKDGEIQHLTEEMLMVQSGISPTCEEWEKAKNVLEKMQKLGMITLDNALITIKNWRKRQEIALSGYERVKRFREKQSNDNNDNESDNTRIEKNRIEKNREEDTMSASADAFNQFWDKYPKKELKKKTQEIWKRKKLDSKLKEILEFIEKASATDRWKKGFVKQPPAFLNGECWEDNTSEYNDKFKKAGREILENLNV